MLLNDRTSNVKGLFEKTEIYLSKDAHVYLRSMIVRDLLGPIHDVSILDLGCGNGMISLQFLENRNSLTLVDLSCNMLELAKQNTADEKRPFVEYVQSDIQSFAPQKRFDVILCIGVLAHVASVDATVEKISQWLLPGGRCIFQFTDSATLVGRLTTAYYAQMSERHDGYKLNSIVHRRFVATTQCHSLRYTNGRQFFSILPGMGGLPNKWLYKFQLLTLRNAFLSRIGSERILLFKKTA